MPFDGVDSIDPRLTALGRIEFILPSPDTWVKHTYRTPKGRYCLKEVLNIIHTKLLDAPILRAVQQVTGREFCSVESFNDHDDTTFDTVQQVLAQTRRNIETATGQSVPINIPKRGVHELMIAGLVGIAMIFHVFPSI